MVQASGQIYRGVWADGPVGGNVTGMPEYIPDAGAVVWRSMTAMSARSLTTGTSPAATTRASFCTGRSAWTAGSACLMSSTRSDAGRRPAQRRHQRRPQPEYTVVDKGGQSQGDDTRRTSTPRMAPKRWGKHQDHAPRDLALTASGTGACWCIRAATPIRC